jgi:predicted MPP superfamily phosphohydrolase
VAGAGAAAATGLAWGAFEAGWVRLRELATAVERLPPELDGLRIAHLSDFHLGVPSRGSHAVARAVEWAAERRPDLVVATGDLLSHPRGLPELRRLVELVPNALVVLGNHDYGVARDPFAQRAAPFELPVRVLSDEAVTLELRGRRVQIVGMDPRSHMRRSWRPEMIADPEAALRILLVHFPRRFDMLEPGVFHLVLSGHLHDGQICVPYGPGKLRLAHPRFPYPCGLYRSTAGTLHVSPGLGTTFVPFRFCARPEATELVLRRSMSESDTSRV